MPIAAEHAFKEKSAKLLILLPLRTILKRTFQCETPCKLDVQHMSTSSYHLAMPRLFEIVSVKTRICIYICILKCLYSKCIISGPYPNSNLSLNLNEIWQLIKLTKMAILSRNYTFSSKYQCRGSKLFFILLLHYNPA